MAKRRPTLGSHLEWHGNKIRAWVRVPPSLVKVAGTTKLKETLPTSSPKDAEALKWAALARMKGRIKDLRRGQPGGDRLVMEAFGWREARITEAEQLETGEIDSDDAVVDYALEDRIERVEREEGSQRRDLFTAVALGVATPLNSLVDEWLREACLAGRTEAAYRHAVKLLETWCVEVKARPSVEAINKRLAGRFVTERFINTGAAPATANKAITGLRAYWAWLARRGHLADDSANPWEHQSVKDRGRERRKGQREPGDGDKRPFTDKEVQTLLEGIKNQTLIDFVRVAALTGMRRDEVARLKVKHLKDGIIKVPGTKTENAVRDVPLHPDLAAIFTRRMKAKDAEAYLFDELPEQANPARGRGAPITQAFTYARRKLGVDDVPKGARQSRVDLHSWRRWFIRQAVKALEEGATGFTAWTIADVVGHSNEDGPLPMTMGRYPGRADVKALRACVESVRLP